MFVSLLLASVLPPPSQDNSSQVLAWTAGEVRCGAQTVSPDEPRRPDVILAWPGLKAQPIMLHFSIDRNGRPVGVTREAESGSVPLSDDIEPAFVANRFAAGAAHRDCRVTFTPVISPVAQAPVADLIAYSLDQRTGTLPQAAWDRITPPGTCVKEPRPMPLTRVLPDFDALPGTPGARGWSMVQYDTDGKGRPIKARVTLGTGNDALNTASIAAINASRFTQGARTGCLYPFWRAPVVMPAPEPTVDEDALRPANASCPVTHGWATPPVLSFPEPFRRRLIEGWAILAYDVAPWGEIGNVRVLAAEPAAAFGAQAINVLRTARLPASERGFTGCVDRVRFVMGKRGQPGNVPAAENVAPPF